MAQLLSLHLLCLVVGLLAEPTPGRIPKVYNALITSNQNLESSKAYPVYQPVLHDATFAFPFQPAVFYGDLPINNGILPVPAVPPKDQNANQAPSPAPPANPLLGAKQLPTQAPPAAAEGDISQPNSTPTPPLPPNTESPIPLNEFGLPPQVLPLGRLNPAYSGFTQIGPFSYTYPGLRFYDPFDPFSLNPYAGLPPLYRPLSNILEQSAPAIAIKESPVAAASKEQSVQSPPPEPSGLNVLNYSSKDPAIPNVPPPPLPQGGLKSDKSD